MNIYLGTCIAAAQLMAAPGHGSEDAGWLAGGAPAHAVTAQILEQLRAGERTQLRRAIDRALAQQRSEILASLASGVTRTPDAVIAVR